MSQAMLVGTVLALLLVGVPLWAGLTPSGSLQRRGLHGRARRAQVLRRAGGDLCTLSGVLSGVCALGARGLLGTTATLVMFLGLLQLGFGLTWLRAMRASRAPTVRWPRVRSQG